MKTTFFFIALVLMPILTACAKPGRSSLPPCQTTDAYWTNCIGEKGRYVGEWKDNEYNGQGTHTWPDGAKYVGEFRDGLRNGRGTMVWPDGITYVGEFRDGLRNGRGTQTYPDGRVESGQWENGGLLGP